MDELQLAGSQVDEEDIALLERLEHGGMQHLEGVVASLYKQSADDYDTHEQCRLLEAVGKGAGPDGARSYRMVDAADLTLE